MIYGRLSIFRYQKVVPTSLFLLMRGVCLKFGSYSIIVGSLILKYFAKRIGTKLTPKYPINKAFDKKGLDKKITQAVMTTRPTILLKTVNTVYLFISVRVIFKRFLTYLEFILSMYEFFKNNVTKTSKKVTSPAYTNRPLRGEDKTATTDPITKPVNTIWMRRAKGFLCCLVKAIYVPYFIRFSIPNFIPKIHQNKENSYVF